MSLQHRRSGPSDRSAFHDSVLTQLAALCWRDGADCREVLLVTSSTGRWILPKGWPIGGKSGGETALTEAWEEGGVSRAKVARKPLGTYIGAKRTETGDDLPCRTHVYAVRVRECRDDFPEKDRRQRLWVPVAQAIDMVTEDGLRDILRAL
jgi:8-oxo-dGTP pyrophosphatase MutT (NUDIX family)